MEKQEKYTMNMENCTQDCSTCISKCNIDLGEAGPSFFDRLESISESFDEVGEENIINMLNEAVAALEAEEAAEEAAENGTAGSEEKAD